MRARSGALATVAVLVLAALGWFAPAAPAASPTDRMFAWGRNFYGQLGDNSNSNRLAPNPVILPAGTTVSDVAGGGEHTLALTSAGRVLAVGHNGDGTSGCGELGDGTAISRTLLQPVSLPAGI